MIALEIERRLRARAGNVLPLQVAGRRRAAAVRYLWAAVVLASFSIALPGATADDPLAVGAPGLVGPLVHPSLLQTPADPHAVGQVVNREVPLAAMLPAAGASACAASPSPAPFPTVKLTGFFQADAVWFGQSDANRLAVGRGNLSAGDVQDGADFRRARLAGVGKAWDNVAYMLEMDFAFPGRPSFMDVWLELEEAVPFATLRIGQFRQPLGMDGQTSVKDLTFLERGLPFAFLPFRQIGAMVSDPVPDDEVTWAASVFRFPTDAFGGNVGDNGGYGFATRLTRVLASEQQASPLLHFGGGYSFIDPANDVVRYRNQPEVFVGETGGGGLVPVGVPSNVPPFVDTGLLPTDQVNLFNIELATAWGAFYTQSEAFFAVVGQQAGPNLVFPGYYVHAAYLLTGESREYNRRAGVFQRVVPHSSTGRQGGSGAWEVAVRWSHIDLTDENVAGGRLNDLTGGVNWYLNPHTKFQFNYIHAFLDSPLNGRSGADIVALRAQLDF